MACGLESISKVHLCGLFLVAALTYFSHVQSQACWIVHCTALFEDFLSRPGENQFLQDPFLHTYYMINLVLVWYPFSMFGIFQTTQYKMDRTCQMG